MSSGDRKSLELRTKEEMVRGYGLAAATTLGRDWRGHEVEAKASSVDIVFIREAIFWAGRGGAQPSGG